MMSVRKDASSVFGASCVGAAAEAAEALLLRFLVAVVGFFALPCVTPLGDSVLGTSGTLFVERRVERRRDMLACLYAAVEIEWIVDYLD